jgi:hypothetical protein
LEGVNPPNFEIYISILISELGGIEWFAPLTRFFPKREFEVLGRWWADAFLKMSGFGTGQHFKPKGLWRVHSVH